MVAIVSGSSLGLNLSSLALAGVGGRYGTATQGRNNETAHVNVASGNLVLQNLDSMLQGVGGSDVLSLRTYNSQGFAASTGWRWGQYKSVVVAGQFLQRTDGDGSVSLYAWSADRQAFVQTLATGTAVDTLVANEDGSYTWTDGASGSREIYEGGAAGLIRTAVDAAGNVTTFTHDPAGLLTSVATAGGESVHYTYEDGKLTQIHTTLADGRSLSQVEYSYDGQGRLRSVAVNLDPDATQPTEGAAGRYVTTYGYDGDSSRVASVQFGDGTQSTYAYELVDGTYRVAAVADGNGRVTRFSYDTASRTTTVTDPLGVACVYRYDEAGRLLQVREGVTAARAAGLSQLDYTYNDLGEVASVTDAAGRTVTMQYDAQGNLVSKSDGAGNTTTWTYNADNQVRTETLYLRPAGAAAPASQPQTVRYVYAADHPTRLRFVISTAGQLTEHRYDATGMRIATLRFTAATFDTSALDAAAVPAEADMQAWAAAQPLAGNQRQDFAYDFRGQLRTTTTFARLDAAGDGLAGTAATTHYVYDQRGALLQTISPDGDSIVQTVYDGLGRVLSTTTRAADGSLSATNITQYDDALGRTIITFAGGLVATSAYDHAGRLVSVTQSSGTTALGVTRFAYDAAGRLLMTTDPAGTRNWALHDDAGRKQADIDATGRLTEYTYDAGGLLVRATSYHTAVNVSLLVDAEGNPTAGQPADPDAPSGTPLVTLEALRPAATTQDAKSWNIYDAASRLAWQINALGEVTHTEYDGASRITSTTRYATAVDTAQWIDGPVADLASVVAASGQDRTVTYLYGPNGLLAATIDGEGYLVQYEYDAAGQLVQTVAYARRVPRFPAIAALVAAARENQSLDDLLPPEQETDIRSFNYYNSRGQLVGQVDGTGYLTETVYDANGRLARVFRYGQAARGPVNTTATLANLRPESSAQDQVSASSWDALGRLATTTNFEGTVTSHAYDDAGNLIRTTVALDTTEPRTLLARYDVQGRLVAELPATGAALLTGEQTQEEVDAVWQQYALRHTYDAAGRRTSTTDALGHRTVFFHDDAGRLRYVVDAAGSVVETRYDPLGRVTHTTRYASALANDALAGLQGGLLSASANQPAVAALEAAQAGSTENSTTTQSYDAAGRLVQVRNAEGGTTALRYDAFGAVSATTRSLDAERTVTSTHSYDRRGLETATVADEAGIYAASSRVYDAFGRAVRTVDANGHATTMAYDAAGRVVTVTDALGATSTLAYDAFGRVLTQTDARGATTRYAYDATQRSVTVTLPDGMSVATVHNRHGQTLSVTDAEGHTTAHTYDADGRLRATTTPAATTTQTYDRAGRLATTVDGEGHAVAYSYDAVGRVLTRSVDPDGLDLTTRYAYDAKGQQVRVTDPRGVVTQVRYDLAGRVISSTLDPVTAEHPQGLNLTTRFSYDDAGNLLTVTEAGGNVTQYAYDALGRRVRMVVDPQGLALTTTYAYDATGNMVAAETAGARTRYGYDAANRVVFTVDPMGAVTQTFYDANGNVTGNIRYAERIDPEAWEAGSPPPVEPSPARDQEVRIVHDSRNRAVFTLSKTGSGSSYAVVERHFDGNGRVISQKAYAQAIDAEVPLTLEGIPEFLHPNAATDASQRYVYDAAGNLDWSVDGMGGVVRGIHDANGNLIKQVAYATPLVPGQEPSEVVGSPADRVSVFAYDAAGRLSYSVDALGSVTHHVQDAAGNLVQSTAFATRLAAPDAQAPAPTEEDLAGLVVADPADRVSRAVYDSANRQVYSIDAAGAVVRNHYDGSGNLVAHTAFATALAADALPALASEADVLAALTRDPANDRTTQSVFDAAGRRVYGVDALGYVTRTVYDGLGRVTGTTQYAAPVLGLAIGSTVGDIQDRLQPDPSTNRTQTFDYDAAGNLLSASDALGHRERFTYNALGQKQSFVNKNGATWTYEYDAAGRLTAELSPVPVGSGEALSAIDTDTDAAVANDVNDAYGADDPYGAYDSYGAYDTYGEYGEYGEYGGDNGGGDTGGGDSGGGGGPVFVRTELAYDALGNLIARTEAANTSLARTTRYVYDARGRQVQTIFSEVQVYDASRDEIHDRSRFNLETAGDVYYGGLWFGEVRTETVQQLSSRVVYNAFGEAVANIDVTGHVSAKVYDKTGQLVYDVDALGYVTHHARNTFGDVTALTRHAQAGEPATPQGMWAGPVPSSADDRTVTTEYDHLGRAVQVTQPAVWVASANGPGYEAASVTRTRYNAFGQVVQVAVLADATAQLWATTTHYLNRRGDEIATIDAMGYLTTKYHDAAGNVVAMTEHALAAATWSIDGYEPPPASADDRRTVYTYDLANRMTAQTRQQVSYSAVPEQEASAGDDAGYGGTLTPMEGIPTVGDLTTTYGHDALGNRTRVTDALGHSTYTYYDPLGRVRAVAGPQYRNGVESAFIIPLTEFQRDALGNVVVQTQGAAASADEAAYVTGDMSRLTLTAYDRLGRPIQVTDPTGAVRSMSYDAAGRLAKSWQVIERGYYENLRVLYTGYHYDALGHLTGLTTPASASYLIGGTPDIQAQTLLLAQEEVGSQKTSMRWNAFGEMVASGTHHAEAATEYQEWFQYDPAGRLWRTNSGDGNVRILLHDLQGRVTAQLTSAGSAGSTTDPGVNLSELANAQAADALGSADVRRTDLQLDLLGRMLTEALPERGDGTSGPDGPAYRPQVHRSYDRWGNVLTQSDPRRADWITRFAYNADNLLTQQVQPDASGAMGPDSPITLLYYDALGRQVAVRDANGHVNGQRWNGAGQLVQELHADGGIITHHYDALANRTRTIDAMGGVTDFAYDGMGRLTSRTVHGVLNYSEPYTITIDPALESTTQTQRWEYDEAGRVTRRQFSESDPGAKVFYIYDGRGNILYRLDGGFQLDWSTYDAFDRLTSRTDLDGYYSTWTYDAFGQVLAHRDLGGAEYTYDYDAARQLVTQANTRGQHLSYRYDAAGQVTGVTDHALDQQTAYAYDAAGRRLREQTVQAGVTWQDQELEYDALGRLAIVSGLDGVTLRNTYDKVGNRLHQRTDYNVRQPQQVTDYGTVTTTDEEGNTVTQTVVTGSHIEQRSVAQHQDLWFAYDSMNRQTLVDGASSSNVADAANLTATQGHLVSYDLNGNRTSDTFIDERIVAVHTLDGDGEVVSTRYEARSGRTTEWYGYDALNRLTSVALGALTETTSAEGQVTTAQADREAALVVDRRLYSDSSVVLRSGPAGQLPAAYLQALGNAVAAGRTDLGSAVTTTSLYYSSGQLSMQRVVNEAQGAATPADGEFPVEVVIGVGDGTEVDTSRSHDVRYFYDPSRSRLEGYRVEQGGISTQYGVNWQGYDGWRQAEVTATSTNTSSGNTTTGTTTNSYDVNGNLLGVSDSRQAANNRQFINDFSGQVLWKQQQDHQMRQLVAAGQVLGRYGMGVDPQDPTHADGSPNYVMQGDFSHGYQAVGPGTPAPGTAWHTVQAGDTLQGIALFTYGDAALWYVIAEANGLAGNGDLRVGQILELPARLGGAANHAGTVAPYDPAAIIGDTSPYTPTPPGLMDGGCGVFGVLLMVAVAVAVTVVTQGALATQMVTWLGSGTTAAVATGAAAGAAGGIASQAVGKAVGLVEHFDWKGVALAAVAGGASAGVSGMQINGVRVGGIEALAADTSAAAAARSMVANAVTQRVSVALGLTETFDWKGVAAAGLGAWSGQRVGEWLRQPALTGSVTAAERAAASGMTASLVTAVAQGGRLNAIQVAVDIFGNQLGQSLAEAMLPRSAVVNTARSGGLPFADDQTLVLRDGGPAPNPEATRSFVDTLGGMMVRQSLETVSLAGTTQYADARTAQQRDRLRVGGVLLDAELLSKPASMRRNNNDLQALLDAARSLSPDVGLRLSTQAAVAKQEFRRFEIQQLNEAATQAGLFTIESAALASVAAQPLSPAMQHVEVALQGAAGVVTEVPATLYDLGQVAYGVAYTELTGHAPDLTMRSSQGTAAQGGASTGELLQNLNPVYSGLVAQHEIREALKRGDTRPLAAIGAGLLTGAAMGRMLPSVPGYRPGGPTSFGNVGEAGQSISGAATLGRKPPTWGKTPQATEFLYVQNRTSPLSIESALNQADELGALRGNLVDYEVLPNGSVMVDHGGGLSINYRAVPDDVFDAYHGPNKMAAYRTPQAFTPNELISWGDAFEGGVANVHIRQSTLLSDRGSVAAFGHEYGELQTVYDRVGSGSYTLGKWDSFINGAHEQIVPQVDNIIGSMIISGGR